MCEVLYVKCVLPPVAFNIVKKCKWFASQVLCGIDVSESPFVWLVVTHS